ncbi:MAG: LuxR C-terminal-related transcriptional regulator [Candidatus Omnitrophota bacterium]
MNIAGRGYRGKESVEKKSFLAAVLNSLELPFYIINAEDFTIEIADKSAMPDGMTKKMTCYEFTHNQKKPCSGKLHICPIKEIKKTKRFTIVNHTHYDKAGKSRDVEVHAYPILNKQGEVIRVIKYSYDVTERKKMEKTLRNSEQELCKQKAALEQKNIALKEIIAQIELEKNKIKDDIAINAREVLLPILEKMKIQGIDPEYINILRGHLKELMSSFGRKLTKKSLALTSREIEICNVIKGGLTSKEAANLLHISRQTIEKHRKNIRKKMGITNKTINLHSFLQQL